jgi:hypothetical protein
MLTFTYYKIAGSWYLDLPDYLEKGGAPEDLERTGSLKDLLERAAQGNSSVQLVLDTQPFEGAEEALLIGESGSRSGAYYLIETIMGQRVDFEIWVNDFIYLFHNELPPKIYGKFII